MGIALYCIDCILLQIAFYCILRYCIVCCCIVFDRIVEYWIVLQSDAVFILLCCIVVYRIVLFVWDCIAK